MFDTFSLICQYFLLYENNSFIPSRLKFHSSIPSNDVTLSEFCALLNVLFGDHLGPIKCQVKTAELSVQSKGLSCFDGLPVAIS